MYVITGNNKFYLISSASIIKKTLTLGGWHHKLQPILSYMEPRQGKYSKEQRFFRYEFADIIERGAKNSK